MAQTFSHYMSDIWVFLFQAFGICLALPFSFPGFKLLFSRSLERKSQENPKKHGKEKERCSGSYRLYHGTHGEIPKENHQTNKGKENCQWKIECFLEDLFLGGQSSIILGYRRSSVNSLLVWPSTAVTINGLEEEKPPWLDGLIHKSPRK